MSDFILDQYDEYLQSFHAWGHEFFGHPLTLDEFEELSVEAEDIDIAEECNVLTETQRIRREEIEKLTLNHESYFREGPRVFTTPSAVRRK